MLTIPSIPASSITVNARYGLHAGSGDLYSIRVAFPLAAGTLINAERFLRPYALYTGASYPGTKRLYEFTIGFVIAVIAGACFKRPPMKCNASFERPVSELGSEKRFLSPLKTDW